jgi:hypothetical protein
MTIISKSLHVCKRVRNYMYRYRNIQISSEENLVNQATVVVVLAKIHELFVWEYKISSEVISCNRLQYW